MLKSTGAIQSHSLIEVNIKTSFNNAPIVVNGETVEFLFSITTSITIAFCLCDGTVPQSRINEIKIDSTSVSV